MSNGEPGMKLIYIPPILIRGETPSVRTSQGGGRIKGLFPILIADENSATLEFFSCLLENSGFAIVTAGSGEEAWELRAQHQFCAVLIGDLMKPPIDGLDLIRRMRCYHMPIIVATSYGADYMLLARLAGARIVIHKFVEPTYLIATIKMAFGIDRQTISGDDFSGDDLLP